MSDTVALPSALLAAMKAMRAGLTTGLPAGVTQIAADGKVSAVTDVQTELDGYIAVYQTADDAEFAYKKALNARDDISADVLPRYEALRTSLKGMLGKKSPDLTKVGLTPDKTPAPLTVEQKQERVAKAQATRKARGTMGPKQKAAIHGAAPSPTPPAGTPKVGP